jgi:hypothetical protein
VRQQLPVPKFTGAQLMIGVEGTPAVVPTEATKKTDPPAPAPVAGNGNKTAGDGNGVKNPLEAPRGNGDVKPPQPQGGGTPAEAPKPPAGERPLKY